MPDALSTGRVLLLGVALLAVGTLGFYSVPGLLEGADRWSISRLVDAFYCSTMTLTT
jgi:ABC-type spermidine/putrescine transport system permease subunit I